MKTNWLHAALWGVVVLGLFGASLAATLLLFCDLSPLALVATISMLGAFICVPAAVISDKDYRDVLLGRPRPADDLPEAPKLSNGPRY